LFKGETSDGIVGGKLYKYKYASLSVSSVIIKCVVLLDIPNGSLFPLAEILKCVPVYVPSIEYLYTFAPV